MEAFEQIKTLRNHLAHEMPDFLSKGANQEYIDSFRNMVSLLDKIVKWWIIFFEIPINPEFDDTEIDEATIVPGPVMLVQLMLDVALGSDEEANKYYSYYSELQKRANLGPKTH